MAKAGLLKDPLLSVQMLTIRCLMKSGRCLPSTTSCQTACLMSTATSATFDEATTKRSNLHTIRFVFRPVQLLTSPATVLPPFASRTLLQVRTVSALVRSAARAGALRIAIIGQPDDHRLCTVVNRAGLGRPGFLHLLSNAVVELFDSRTLLRRALGSVAEWQWAGRGDLPRCMRVSRCLCRTSRRRMWTLCRFGLHP